MSELRVALVLGGGVSLGSFSAGALLRVLRLLAHVERGPAKIDVASGASAGSMTLALMIYHLMRGSSLDELERALRAAWVERISFDALRPEPGSHELPSLFSDRIVRSIAHDELNFERWAPASEPHPLFAEGTLLSLALTNLNGIPLRAEGQLIRQPSSRSSGAESVFADAMQATFHDDVMRFAVHRDSAATGSPAGARARTLLPWHDAASRAEWAVFREAALASGAFPGAFPPVRLSRSRSEFQIWPEELERDEFTFDYVDGGVLRNEPLREAIELAAIQDRGRDVERVFIFIDPHISGTRESYPLAFNRDLSLHQIFDERRGTTATSLQVPDYTARLGGVLFRLLDVLSNQAAFRDWLRAARINSQIEWREELLEVLDELEPRAGSDVEGRIERLLERIYSEKFSRGSSSAGPPDPGKVRAQLERDLALRSGDAHSSFSTKVHLLLDLVANLREKSKLNIVAITPASGVEAEALPLAGDFLSNFGGFFDERFRSYDFALGESIASEVLHAEIAGARPLLRADAPECERPIPPASDPRYRDLEGPLRERFERFVADHALAFAPRLGLPRLLHRLFASKLRDRVRSQLSRDEPGPRASFTVEIEGARNLFLKGVPGGRDQPSDPHGRVRTLVTAHGSGQGPEALSGPHLVGASPAPALELWERRFLRPSLRKKVIRLNGEREAWFKGARYRSLPMLKVVLTDGDEIVLTPHDLSDPPGPKSH